MLIHVQFLWNHANILLASVILVVIVKAITVTGVVKVFAYSFRTSFSVGNIDSALLIQHILNIKSKFVFLDPTLLFQFVPIIGGSFVGTDWRICICTIEPCFKSSSC
ncbi:hypothetical protein HPP92_002300 [Vanilla planifolia]|uniref:Uncharacterized protein n=1 Tax=Vanilla planifolia TaxID=51239 RepID=A0A835S452_VANPL|nr:hypothetical protein HPP92_002294 [Vanilla planifolia]KAG0502228.1 hypothetical protein HPP92_002300 [Vanilla planifolia]